MNSICFSSSSSAVVRRFVRLASLSILFVFNFFPGLAARPLFAQTLKADYQFVNTRSSSVAGAPDLTDLGPGSNGFLIDNVHGTMQPVLHFPLGNGLRLTPTTGVIPNAVYTIALVFKIDAGGYRRLVDFKNGIGDPGLYVEDTNHLQFFIFGLTSPTGSTAIAPNTYVQVVLTRDGAGTVIGYVNGVPQFQFDDAADQLAVIDTNNALRFFRDNESGGPTTEHAAGSVARIRLYDGALTPVQVAALEPILLVTTVDDHNDGVCNEADCTLREAITRANTGDVRSITFASGVTGTIQLTGVLPSLSQSMTILGPGANLLTVRRNTGGTYRIFNVSSGVSVTLSGLTINNGVAANEDGGGIFNSGNLTLRDCSVNSNNSTNSGAGGNGGGIYNATGGTLTLFRCTLRSNTVSQFGGAVYNDATFTATNCTFANNNAFRGGAIISRFANGLSSSTLRNCTIASNTANSTGGGSADGGGGFYAEGGAQQVHVSNTIIARNTNAINPDVRGSYTSDGHNFIGSIGNAAGFTNGVNGDQVGNNATPLNPQLGLLSDNGGPTQTLALLNASTAINAGDDVLAPLSDQRRYLRAGGSDIGAFEFNGVPPVPTVLSAVSQKMHGGSATYNIALPLTGPAGVECRAGGAGGTHQVIVTFASTVSVGGVSVISSDGLATATRSVSGAVVTVDLSAVANAQTLGITLMGVSDGTDAGDVFVPMSVLLGDTTGNGTVNSTDVSQTKLKSGQAVDATSFRQDVTVSNSINATDVGIVKLRVGTALP